MAHHALATYRADINAGEDAPLICSTPEMAEALNTRSHEQPINPHASTDTAARHHSSVTSPVEAASASSPPIWV
jgi:hypothetical protein